MPLRLCTDRVYRKAKKIGDDDVPAISKRIGISPTTFYRLAAGTTAPSLPTLWALRHAYGLKLDALVYDDQPAQP